MLMAAAGKVKITPEEAVGLAGFDPEKYIAMPPQDILDDLYARILILDDGSQRTMLVSVDCCMTNEELGRVCDPSGAPGQYREFREMFAPGTRQSFAAAAGMDESNVMVCATHTHSAPEHYSEKYVSRIREKIREVASQLVPVTLTVSVGNSAISAYRRPTLYPNPEVPIDQTLYVVLLHTQGGVPLAGIVNYAVHPTILHPSEVQSANRVSTECVGTAMNEIEDDLGTDFVCLFTQGFSGDVAPSLPGIGTREDSYGNVKKAGHQLYLDIIRALRDKREITPTQVRTARRTVSLPARDGFYKNALEATMTAVSFGEVSMLFVPGEIFNGYVSKISQKSPFPYTILTSLTNGYLGYFPTVEAFRDGKGGYEMTTTPFDHRLDEIFTAGAVQLLHTLVHRTEE